MKYKKKPVVIEAVKLDKTNIREAYLFCHPNEPQTFNGTTQELVLWDEYEDIVRRDGLKIETLEGVMTAQIGDYIIKGVNGEFYPCKPDIFQKTYEVVE
jgi:hypothetical protein